MPPPPRTPVRASRPFNSWQTSTPGQEHRHLRIEVAVNVWATQLIQGRAPQMNPQHCLQWARGPDPALDLGHAQQWGAGGRTRGRWERAAPSPRQSTQHHGPSPAQSHVWHRSSSAQQGPSSQHGNRRADGRQRWKRMPNPKTHLAEGKENTLDVSRIPRRCCPPRCLALP